MIIGYTFDGVSYPAAPFAQMVDELLDHNEGIVSGISLSNTTSKITIGDGRLIIKGRAFEVKGGEEVDVPETQSGELYCVLVAEIDLSKESSDSKFEQVAFKYLASANNYPSLTQQDINNTQSENGIYQFELARFKNSVSGIKNFEDTRTFLNLDGIFSSANNKTNAIINSIQQELANVKDGSTYFLKATQLTNQDLNDYKTEGFYYAAGGNNCLNKPSGVNNFGIQVKRIASGVYEQILDCSGINYTRFYNGTTWSSWVKTITNGDFAVIIGSTTTEEGDSLIATTEFNYPTGFNINNCTVISIMGARTVGDFDYPWTTTLGKDSSSYLLGCAELGVVLDEDKITVRRSKISDAEPSTTKKFRLVLMKLPTYEDVKLGDLNDDGQVTTADKTLMQNFITGNGILSNKQWLAGDINKDGAINITDLGLIQRIIDGTYTP